ncbi:MAG: thioredoxin, partial [Bacteroidota bacterium]
VIKNLNGYYCLRLNTEEEKDIHFLNRTYQLRPTGHRLGVHELARYLGTINGGLVLPTTVVLNEKLEVVKKERGYLDPAYFRRWLPGK